MIFFVQTTLHYKTITGSLTLKNKMLLGKSMYLHLLNVITGMSDCETKFTPTQILVQSTRHFLL